MPPTAHRSPRAARAAGIGAVLRASIRLGLTSFGGPIAHLAYFRREYVERRRWLDEETYADLVALCQFLPGPASTQLGIAIGTLRAGRLGGAAAWLGFTLPSAVALVVLGLATGAVDLRDAGWVHGLKLAAVAVVAQAVLAMWRSLAPDLVRSSLVIAALVVALVWSSPVAQLGVIAGGAALGRLLLPSPGMGLPTGPGSVVGRRFAIGALVVFVALLVGLPALRVTVPDQTIAVTETFYRSGALVFGGGHVVLPLLHESVVPPGWVSDDRFLAGYGAAQAVPGPLFTFAGYLGAVLGPAPNGVPGAALALGAIFLPSFLLVWGVLPFWDALRRNDAARRAMAGTNAAVVGLLAAALYTPIWTSAVLRPLDAVAAAGLAGLFILGRIPPLAIVLLAAATGELLARVPG